MKQIDAAELSKRMTDEDPVVVNVLPAAKYEAAHIPGSLHADLGAGDFVSRVTRYAAGDKRQPIVVYCSGPHCNASTKAAEQLLAAGFTDVARYEGGIEDWQQQGHAIVSSSRAK